MFDNEIIKSNQNPSVVLYSKLKNSKFRREEGLFLCEGYKLASEAIRAGVVRRLLLRSDVAAHFSELASDCRGSGGEVVVLAESPFAKVSTEIAPQGVIAICETSCVSSYSYTEGSVFVCSGIRDPGNLGTIIRSAAGFGYDSVFLHDCADVYNPKTVRSSMGAIFRTNLLAVDDLLSAIADLRRNDRRVIACTLEENSFILGEFDVSSSDVFVVGNEGHGLSSELVAACSASVFIPMRNGVESFNAAMASCVIQWEQSKSFS